MTKDYNGTGQLNVYATYQLMASVRSTRVVELVRDLRDLDWFLQSYVLLIDFSVKIIFFNRKLR